MIKSHCEAPDWEDWCEAENEWEAAKIFAERLSKYEPWSPEDIIKSVYVAS